MTTVVAHIDRVSTRLSQLATSQQTAFALLMAARLMEASRPWFKENGSNQAESLYVFVDAVRAWLDGGVRPPEKLARITEESCHSLVRDEPDGEEERFRWYRALETLEAVTDLTSVFREPNSFRAAQAGERALNVIDYRLNMLEGVEHTESHSAMVAEFGVQLTLLDQLERVDPERPLTGLSASPGLEE